MTDWLRAATTRQIETALAQERIAEISRKYAQVGELRKSDGSVRHKCFVSYHSDDASEALSFIQTFEDVMIPRSLGVSDDDGPLIQSSDNDYIMERIRSIYLADSTVTIVLIGKCTWSRKFIDWEVYSSLRRSKNSSLNGLLAIQLPSASATNPKLPPRVADNVPNASSGDRFGRYYKYPSSKAAAQSIIQDAFEARKSRVSLIRSGRDRRANNSACP